MIAMDDLETLAVAVGTRLLERGEWLATAESCTGGWVAQAVTAIAGSSTWFDRGFVTYSNAAKMDMLGVAETTLERHGAVSEATARAMAQGVLAHSRADWSLAITGIAGPTGGTKKKPVGLVYIAAASRHYKDAIVIKNLFKGSRASVRAKSADKALTVLKRLHAFF